VRHGAGCKHVAPRVQLLSNNADPVMQCTPKMDGTARPVWHTDRVLPADGIPVVYLLRCGPQGSLYCGWSNRLATRLKHHQTGKGAKYTKAHQPVTLVWWQAATNAREARQWEAQVKALPRAAKLELVAGARSLPTTVEQENNEK
jgi:putative endonuclease